MFTSKLTVDEIGNNPPGDEIAGIEVPSKQGWMEKIINVRQGGVIAQIKYTWREGVGVPSTRIMSIIKMIVDRIKQVQRGGAPIASAR
ncbi:hypothetical protein [Streptomyces halobius]|uniref:Uncharacterized protein n=1 Tax=Streptomyces halobius TaxID=2879846 RepID=A0ABY4M187_9ACTN|nr:hypothetical protein [Streptomyces halobius]UQA91187.1 hypothetical protein K9S39_04190 [Streptomyces halobius]